jgi:DNA-binding transcriptional regulator YiaG
MGIPALPFCKVRLSARKIRDFKYPKEPKTLGDFLRISRLDRGLKQKMVASLLEVSETAVYNWERNRAQPSIRQAARIIEFIGYDPISVGERLDEQLLAVRRRRGLSQRALARLLKIDPTTLARWERRRDGPRSGLPKRVEPMLRSLLSED